MNDEKTVDKDYYGLTARYYDPAYASDRRLRDVPFYVELARSAGGPVLEVACGTGRVLLPVAREGIEIDGLDFSPYLLDILREKLLREPEEVRDRVSVFDGDMRTFSTGKSYDLVMIPFRPLQHLYSVEDQLSTFKNCNSHLNPGGRIGFNVFYPNFALLEKPAEEIADLEWQDPDDPSITVKRFFKRDKVNKLNQYFQGTFIFRSYKDEKLINEEKSGLKMGYYTYPHLQLLLKVTGFKITEEYGSFEKEPIDICNEMIIIAEKTKEPE